MVPPRKSKTKKVNLRPFSPLRSSENENKNRFSRDGWSEKVRILRNLRNEILLMYRNIPSATYFMCCRNRLINSKGHSIHGANRPGKAGSQPGAEGRGGGTHPPTRLLYSQSQQNHRAVHLPASSYSTLLPTSSAKI